MKTWRMSFRCGNKGFEMRPRCFELGVAAITYRPLARIDLSKYPQGEPKNLWAKLQPSQSASLKRVVYEMKKGDVIYVKEGPMIVGKGVVTGSYKFDGSFRLSCPDSDVPWSHQVPVAWETDFQAVRLLLGSEPTTVLPIEGARLQLIERTIYGTQKGIAQREAIEGKRYKWWVYKCNSRNLPYQRANGDWRDFFDRGKKQDWGSTDWIPALGDLNVGDLIIAYQTNRNELTGLAKVGQTSEKDTNVYLKPLESISVKVRPLKKINSKIASIQALQPGPIKTIYPISDADARELLKAAGSTYEISPRANQEFQKQKPRARTSGGGFGSVENNAEVEVAAIDFVKRSYCKEGWQVESVERDRCSFDLRCKKNKTVLEVEVKGIKGKTEEFIITAGEVNQASNSMKSVVCVVTAATSRAPNLSKYSGKEFLKNFALAPIQFRAKLRS